MKQANENVIIQLAVPERKFVKVYQDFLRNELLGIDEKMVFIALKSFVDFSKDNGGTQGEVYPSLDTICRLSSLSKPRVIKAINKLVEKKIVKKIRRGLSKTNVYILSDFATMWTCDNAEEMATAADNKGEKPLTAEKYIAELKRMGYKVTIEKDTKEKEPVSDDDQITDTSTCKSDLHNNITEEPESQERYPMPFLKDFFEYKALIAQNPEKRTDVDIIFDLLYDTLNTQKPTIRINGEDKERNVVIGKLMKLQFEDFPYVIDKYHEQTGRIRNVKAYLLTILYHAREQSYLDIMNLGHHNGDF